MILTKKPRLDCFPGGEFLRMTRKMLHPPIQFLDDFGRYGKLRRVRLKVVLQFCYERQLLGRQEPPHFWKPLKNHGCRIIPTRADDKKFDATAQKSPFPRQVRVSHIILTNLILIAEYWAKTITIIGLTLRPSLCQI
jgi:hypothetical protein